jgi:hypothetical protein
MNVMGLPARPPKPAAPSTPAPPSDRLAWTLAEAARACGVCVKTFKTWPIPRFHVGRVVRVRPDDVRSYVEGQTKGDRK